MLCAIFYVRSQKNYHLPRITSVNIISRHPHDVLLYYVNIRYQ